MPEPLDPWFHDPVQQHHPAPPAFPAPVMEGQEDLRPCSLPHAAPFHQQMHTHGCFNMGEFLGGSPCVSQLRLLEQNTMDWVAYNKFIFSDFGSRSPENRVPAVEFSQSLSSWLADSISLWAHVASPWRMNLERETSLPLLRPPSLLD